MAVVLIGGGSRSGKSRFALKLAREQGGRLGFLATAETLDAEMESRASVHRKQRGSEFVTIEEPFDLPGVLEKQASNLDVLIVDCLTVWVSNVMLSQDRDCKFETERFLAAAQQFSGLLLLVTNEVGAGIIPENELARRFRDLAGWINQEAAYIADRVYWMVFGCPLQVK